MAHSHPTTYRTPHPPPQPNHYVAKYMQNIQKKYTSFLSSKSTHRFSPPQVEKLLSCSLKPAIYPLLSHEGLFSIESSKTTCCPSTPPCSSTLKTAVPRVQTI